MNLLQLLAIITLLVIIIGAKSPYRISYFLGFYIPYVVIIVLLLVCYLIISLTGGE